MKRSAPLRRLQRFVDLLCVPIRLHLAKNLFDFSAGADQKRAALHPHVLPPIHALFHPRAVSFGDLMIHVGQQRERQIELVLEFGLRRALIGRNADDDRIGLGELLRFVAKLATLARSTRRVSLGKEVQHDVLPFE